MSYKAFQDWYHEANIKHLLLFEYNGLLISPPFATELCKDYSDLLIIKNSNEFIKLDIPPGTSKFNCVLDVAGDAWLIPYAIYDHVNVVVQLKDFKPIYHTISSTGKGQFYGGASNGSEGFCFPLGYEGTNYSLHIKNDAVHVIPLDTDNYKLHMGTVYCNGKFYSMPRGDSPGYGSIMCFDGIDYSEIKLPVDTSITRKYSDAVVIDNKIYALPFGETAGLTQVVEFDTDTEQISLWNLDIPDFAKKYNVAVKNAHFIIAVPYGNEDCYDSQWGVVFNTVTKESKKFDIGPSHGGKYRFRCGILYYNLAVFFPTGTPSCPILAVSTAGQVVFRKQFDNILFGRPVIHDQRIKVIGYDTLTREHRLYSFDNSLDFTFSKIDIA
jgi:hypothetical protein